MIAEEPEPEPEPEPEKEEREFDQSVVLDLPKAKTALAMYAQKLKEKQEKVLPALLEGVLEKVTAEHNLLLMTVGPGFESWIRKEEALVPYLREQLGEPKLILDLQVDEDFSLPESDIPYTDEEKLRELERQNPVIEKLQVIFKTRILY